MKPVSAGPGPGRRCGGGGDRHAFVTLERPRTGKVFDGAPCGAPQLPDERSLMEAVVFVLSAVVVAAVAVWSLLVARRALAGREVEAGLRARADLEPVRVLRQVPATDRTEVRAA